MFEKLLPQNAEPLQKQHPRLCERIHHLLQVQPQAHSIVEPLHHETGALLRIRPNHHQASPRGNEGWLHGPIDSFGDFKQRVATIDWRAVSTIVQLGAGWGHTARYLHHHYWKAQLQGDRLRRMIVVEPDVHLWLEALAQEDWSRLLWDSTVWFALGVPFDRLHEHSEVAAYPLALWDPHTLVIAGTEQSVDERIAQQRFETWIRAVTPQASSAVAQTLPESVAVKRQKKIETLLFLSPFHLGFQRRIAAVLEEMGIKVHIAGYDDTSIALYKPWIWLEYIRQLRPDGIVLLNHTSRSLYGHDWLSAVDVPILSWYFDNPQGQPIFPMAHPGSAYITTAKPCRDREIVCCYDRAYLPWLKEQGYESVYQLPVGTGFYPEMARRCPPIRSALSYLGSMVYEVHDLAREFILPESPETGRRLTAMVDEIERSPGRPVYEFLERVVLPDNPLGYSATIRFLEEWTTHRRRMRYLRAVKLLGLEIYGELFWTLPGLAGELTECYRGGPLDYATQTPGLYAHSEISLNINHAQTCQGVSSRVFDVIASGGFVLTDGREAIAEYFEPGRDAACFDTEEELTDLIQYYRKHPSERETMTQRGWMKIRERWTYRHTLSRMLELLQGEGM